jgi:hypothetical protein
VSLYSQLPRAQCVDRNVTHTCCLFVYLTIMNHSKSIETIKIKMFRCVMGVYHREVGIRTLSVLEGFFPFRKCPHLFWGHPSLPFNEYRDSFMEVKRPGRGTVSLCRFSAEVKYTWNCTSTFPYASVVYIWTFL